MTDRRRFDGVRDVVHFNWPTYLATTGIACLLAATRSLFTRIVGTGLLMGIAGSLAAVHVTYDRSGLYELDWLSQLSQSPRTLVLHAGLDDVSAILRQRHAIEHVLPLDIFEHDAETEPSILRARQIRPAAKVATQDEATPISAATFDLALGFLSAHELRTSGKRTAMFERVKVLLTPSGRLVIVEHLRDVPNALAFGWGAMHFFPRSTWISDLERAGFRVEHEQRISLFITVFTASVVR